MPELGRIVHYVLPNGTHRPAIIVQAWPDHRVNLQVFLDGNNDVGLGSADRGLLWVTHVHEGEDDGTAVPNSWHWPEREGE